MMTSRERMFAALAGEPVDCIPIAPYFWGAEYSWQLTGMPIWEALHGKGDMRLAVLDAVDRRHGCDWLMPLHGSTGLLDGKHLTSDDGVCVHFADDVSGEEWVFHRDGHWFGRASDVGRMRIDNEGADVDPPANRDEADDWLRKRHPHIWSDPSAHVPDRTLRERFPDRFLCAPSCTPFAAVAYPMGFAPTMIMLHDNPSLCAYIMERILVHVPHLCESIAADGYDGAMMVDSFASADIMSPETYTNWIAPMHKLVSDELYRAGLKSVMYNTGNILPLLPAMRAMRYDAITWEERIKGVEMDIREVRNAVGPDQCLFGNFDAYLLLEGDRDAIRRETRRMIDAGGTSGFVMGSGSPICDATDPDVIDFWIDEVRGALSP